MITSPRNKMQKRRIIKRRGHRHKWGMPEYEDGLAEQLCLYVGCTAWRVIDENSKVIEQSE